MMTAGIVVLFVALLAWAGFGLQKYKAGRLAKAPFVETNAAASQGEAAAGDKGAISVEGDVEYSELLTSPVTGKDCLYYQVSVVAEWKSGDTKKTHSIMNEKQATDFTLNDGSGPVPVDASGGGDFDALEETYNSKKGRGIVSSSDKIEFGDHGFSVLAGQKIDGIRIPDSAKYKVVEKVLEPTDHLYANGKITEENTVSSPNWASLILSTKSRDELLESTESFAQKLMYGAAAGTVIGGALAGIGALMG